MNTIVHAPWSREQFEALNSYQERGDMHPFTCPENHGDESRVLIATADGWICPSCDYTQKWAHQFMIELGATP